MTLRYLTKEELCNWILSTYDPTHHLTFRLPEHKRTKDLDKSIFCFKDVMVRLQKLLVKNNWHKKHLKFIAVAEPHANDDWHFHTLFNQEIFSTEELEFAIAKMTGQLKLSLDCLYLTTITNDQERLPAYVTKEIFFDYHGHFDSKRLILSHNLFNLPDEATDLSFRLTQSQ